VKRRLLDRILLPAQVHAVMQQTPRQRLVTLTGPALADLNWQPGHQVRLQVAAGPGAQWSRTAQPGDKLMLLQPHGDFTTIPADYHLFAGEETSQVAYGPMLRALPGAAKVFARLEVESRDERLPLSPQADGEHNPNWDIAWSYRHGRPAASSETLVEAVRDLELPPEPGVAYLAGEARTIQMIRSHLVDQRNWPRCNVLTKPFWAPGKKGLD
jgi:NADPH-dependent ferric siderophore reductase